MKKILILSLLTVLLYSCKPTIDARAQNGLKGSWTITNVSFKGSDYFAAKSFQIADSKCFIGSVWELVPNNNKGTMRLTKCTDFSSDIVWSLEADKDFTLKFIGEDAKARKVTQGYILKIANQSTNSFQLVDKMELNGVITDIVYQFERN